MLVLIAGRRKEEVMRNTAAPLDQESPYIAEIWGSWKFKQYMESCTLLRAITSTVESKQSKGCEHVFLGASTCTEHDDQSTYHEPNSTWHRYPILCTRTTDVSLLA